MDIVLDKNAPDLDGLYSALDALKASEDNYLPVLFFSAKEIRMKKQGVTALYIALFYLLTHNVTSSIFPPSANCM